MRANPFADSTDSSTLTAPTGATSEHDRALSAILEWYLGKKRKQVFRLFGPAGTGKTTLSKTIAERIGGNVQFAAFSGKAASVLRGKGCENATTIHALIYTPHTDAKGKVSFSLSEMSPVQSASLAIIDEISMVDARLGKDLESFGTPILVLGDRAQLPPIEGSGYFVNAAADFELNEIHRQDRQNPIVVLASQARAGKHLKIGNYGDSRMLSARDLDVAAVTSADQVLAGKRDTVRRLNVRIRDLLGRPSGVPVRGDKLVCLMNNRPKRIFNGEMWVVDEIEGMKDGVVDLIVKSENDDRRVSVRVDQQYFTSIPSGRLPNSKKQGDAFTFGNVLTVHRAQGSEWKSVVLFDESASFGREASKWLYTGITRASDKILVVRP